MSKEKDKKEKPKEKKEDEDLGEVSYTYWKRESDLQAEQKGQSNPPLITTRTYHLIKTDHINQLLKQLPLLIGFQHNTHKDNTKNDV